VSCGITLPPADEQRDQPAELPEHVEAGEDPTARVLGCGSADRDLLRASNKLV
jgi:hypothetical protein